MDQIEFDFGIAALASYDEDGHAEIQTDSPGLDGEEGTQPAERLMPLGFHAMPLDPDKGPDGDVGLGAPVLTITHGDRRYVIPLQDPRDVGKVPRCRKGGTMMAGGAGDYRSFVAIDGEDPKGVQNAGSITVAASYSKGGVKKTLGFAFNVRNTGKEEISIVHGEGQRITFSASGSRGVVISNAKGDAYVEIGDDGNVLAGNSKVQGSLVVGSQLAAQSVVKGPEFVAFMTQLIGIIAPIVGVSGTGAPAAALTAQLAGLLTQHFKAT